MKVGFYKKVLPINLPIQLAGHKGERIANKICDPLYVRSISLEDKGIKRILISVDILWLDRDQVEEIKRRIYYLAKIPNYDILIACTHTHSGPDTLDWYDFAPPIDQMWLSNLFEAITNAAIQSLKNMTDVYMDFVYGSVSLAINRRLKDENGLVRLRPNSDGPTCQEMHLIRFFTKRKKLRAMILHHAVHPVVLGNDSFCISGDWCGVACTNIEQTLNCNVLYLNGASGDQNPIIWTGKSYNEMIFMAEKFAKAVCETSSTPPQFADDNFIFSNQKDVKILSKPHPYLIKAQQRRLDKELNITFSVQVFKIGPISLITAPGECLIETGWAITSGLDQNPVLVVSYANDYIGYLPMPHIYTEGGYEPSATMLDSVGVMKFVETARDLIKSSFKNES
jgi:neutral ceramidase